MSVRYRNPVRLFHFPTHLTSTSTSFIPKQLTASQPTKLSLSPIKMLLKSLVPTTLAAILIPAAMGNFMTLKKYPHTNCNSRGGPWRHYNEDVCATLSDTDHGISAWFTGSGCTRKCCSVTWRHQYQFWRVWCVSLRLRQQGLHRLTRIPGQWFGWQLSQHSQQRVGDGRQLPLRRTSRKQALVVKSVMSYSGWWDLLMGHSLTFVRKKNWGYGTHLMVLRWQSGGGERRGILWYA